MLTPDPATFALKAPPRWTGVDARPDQASVLLVLFTGIGWEEPSQLSNYRPNALPGHEAERLDQLQEFAIVDLWLGHAGPSETRP